MQRNGTTAIPFGGFECRSNLPGEGRKGRGEGGTFLHPHLKLFQLLPCISANLPFLPALCMIVVLLSIENNFVTKCQQKLLILLSKQQNNWFKLFITLTPSHATLHLQNWHTEANRRLLYIKYTLQSRYCTKAFKFGSVPLLWSELTAKLSNFALFRQMILIAPFIHILDKATLH